MPPKKEKKTKGKKHKKTKLDIKFEGKNMTLADFIRKYYVQLQAMIQEKEKAAVKPPASSLAPSAPPLEEQKYD
jgi:hypothetical protein